ncbi:hypothetical protein, partial [Ornithinimicrobium murale]|uniref:hypothetical protein n=1 Tax=Ornithinimicrobium murale TaxID=1050153 RepID=UPI001EE0898D
MTDQNAPRSPAQIGRLLEIASSQDEAWAQLDGCLRRLREIRQAQQTLATLSPAERAAALASIHRWAGGWAAVGRGQVCDGARVVRARVNCRSARLFHW